MVCTFNDLKDKEVVNICDGRRLGYVCDAELDCVCGKVCALIIPGPSKCFGFIRSGFIKIAWEFVERIGDDIILVNADRIIKKPTVTG